MTRIRLLLTAVAAAALAGLVGCTPQSDARNAVGAPPSAPAAPEAAKPRLATVMIGDSVMSGYLLEPGLDWPQLLGQQTGVGIENLACPGAGFVAVGGCDSDFAGLVSAAAALHPRVVVIQASSNDMSEDPAVVNDATSRTIEELATALPQARIVGLSTIWNDEDPVPAGIAVSSAALEAAVESVGGTYVDVGQPFVGHPELLLPDRVHPTEEGQQAIVTAVRAALDDAGVSIAPDEGD